MANFRGIWREPIIVSVHFPLVWCSFPTESIHRLGMGMTLVPYLVVMACSFHSSVRRVETGLSLALLWDVALSALPPCHPYPSLFFPPLPHILWTVKIFLFELHRYMITGLFFGQMIALLPHHARFPFAWCSFFMGIDSPIWHGNDSGTLFGCSGLLFPFLCSSSGDWSFSGVPLRCGSFRSSASSSLSFSFSFPVTFSDFMNGDIFPFWTPIFLSWLPFTVLWVICPLTALVYDNRILFLPDDCSSVLSRLFPFCLVLFSNGIDSPIWHGNDSGTLFGCHGLLFPLLCSSSGD